LNADVRYLRRGERLSELEERERGKGREGRKMERRKRREGYERKRRREGDRELVGRERSGGGGELESK
jgi:hypothetical protein